MITSVTARGHSITSAVTLRARLSYRRAAEIFEEATRPLADPLDRAQGWTLHQLRHAMLTHEGTPAESHVPAEWRSKIMHARMTIGDWVLMASDAPPGRSQPPQGFSVHISVDEPAEAERIFKALADGGQVRMAMEQTFWAERFGMLVDRFGISWMINCAGSGQPQEA